MTYHEATPFVLAVLFCSTLHRATFGFGDALIAMPLLSLFIAVELATPLVALVSLTGAAIILARDWRGVARGDALRLIVAALFGVPLGAILLTELDHRIVKTFLAALVITFSLYNLWRPRLRAVLGPRWAPVFGFAAGALGGAYNTHGPPIIIFGSLRGWPPQQFRATLQGYFLPVGIAAVLAHALNGRYNAVILTWFVWSLPVVLTSMWIGEHLHRRVRGRDFARLVYGILIAIGLVLLWSAWRAD